MVLCEEHILHYFVVFGIFALGACAEQTKSSTSDEELEQIIREQHVNITIVQNGPGLKRLQLLEACGVRVIPIEPGDDESISATIVQDSLRLECVSMDSDD